LDAFGELRHRERLLLIPGFGRPRGVLPASPTSQERRTLLHARSSDMALPQRVAHAAATRLPLGVLERLGRPVVVATHEPGQLMLALRRLVPGGRVGFILSPPEYRRAIVVVFDSTGRPALVAKFAHEPESVHRLSHERDTLRVLRRLSPLRDTVPDLVTYIRTHLGEALVTSVVSGNPGPTQLTAPLRDWLTRCLVGTPIELQQTELIRRVRARVAGRGTLRAELRPMFERALASLVGCTVPTTVVHGDFAPWNILLEQGAVRVHDWEDASLQGIPGWDQIFFSLQVGLIKRRWAAAALQAGAEQLLRDRPVYYSARQYRALVTIVLIDALVRHSDPGDPAYLDVARCGLRRLGSAGWLEAGP
jgi:hypothetical protein